MQYPGNGNALNFLNVGEEANGRDVQHSSVTASLSPKVVGAPVTTVSSLERVTGESGSATFVPTTSVSTTSLSTTSVLITSVSATSWSLEEMELEQMELEMKQKLGMPREWTRYLLSPVLVQMV